jgi:maltodextrin utilization protein YvdJ
VEKPSLGRKIAVIASSLFLVAFFVVFCGSALLLTGTKSNAMFSSVSVRAPGVTTGTASPPSAPTIDPERK